jgi:hypothetical protein
VSSDSERNVVSVMLSLFEDGSDGNRAQASRGPCLPGRWSSVSKIGGTRTTRHASRCVFYAVIIKVPPEYRS